MTHTRALIVVFTAALALVSAAPAAAQSADPLLGDIGLGGGIAADPNGGLYVSSGTVLLHFSGTSTTADASIRENGWLGRIVVDAAGGLYGGGGDARVQYFSNPRQTTPDRVYGAEGQRGVSASVMGVAFAIGIDPAGGVYVVDGGNSRVLHFSGTNTVADRVYGQNNFTTGNPGLVTYGIFGIQISASTLSLPNGVAADPAGGVYISDRDGNRVLHYSGTSTTPDRVYGQNGSFTTFEGRGLSATSLVWPGPLAADPAGGLYVADTGNRLLHFPGTSTTADRVYCQNGSFTTNKQGNGLTGCYDAGPLVIDSAGGGVYIGDPGNRRVLHFSGTSITPDRIYRSASVSTPSPSNPAAKPVAPTTVAPPQQPLSPVAPVVPSQNAVATQTVQIGQGSDGVLYLVLGNRQWTLVPATIGGADLAAFTSNGEISATIPAQLLARATMSSLPVIAQTGDGSVYLVLGGEVWRLIPAAISDSDLSALGANGEIGDGVLPDAVLSGAPPDSAGAPGPAPSAASASVAGSLTEFALPDPNNWVYDIVAGPDGAMWFDGTFAVGRITLDGMISTFPVPDAQGSRYGIVPGGIAVGPDENLWVTVALLTPNGQSEIGGRIFRVATDGTMKGFELSKPSRVPGGIARGPDGALWFTESEGTPGDQTGYVGRITTSGAVSEFALPNNSNALRGIVAGSDGALWFAEGQSDAQGRTSPGSSKIGRIDTNGAVREFPLSSPDTSTGMAITLGPDGALWFTEGDATNTVTRIGRITTDGRISDYSLTNPIPDTGKNSIISGPDGALWFTYGDNAAGGPSAISRITTDGAVTDYPMEPGVYPWDLAAGPDGAVWVVEGPDLTATPVGASKIGRLAP